MYSIAISENELNEYKEILKTSKITLQDIVFFACKYTLYPGTFSKFKNYQELKKIDKTSYSLSIKIFEEEFKNFSQKFNRIRRLFAIDNCVFLRSGKHNSYSLTYSETVFIRELFIRIKNYKVWDKIITINNRDELGFVKFYHQTSEKQKYFEEIRFFVEEIFHIYDKDYSQNKSLNIRQHISMTTKYPYLRTIQLFNQIKLLSLDKLLECNISMYAAYERYLTELYLNLENEIYKAKEKLLLCFLESSLIEKNRIDTKALLNQNNALIALVNELKKIDTILYSDLREDNFYQHFNNIEGKADYYIKKCFSLRKKTAIKNIWDNNQVYIHYLLRSDLEDAFLNLSKEDKSTLSEPLLKNFFSEIQQ